MKKILFKNNQPPALSSETLNQLQKNIEDALIPIGTIVDYAGDIAPENWLLCQGQEISRTDYAELFEILNIKYGAGDGKSTFNLPDKRGKVSVGLNLENEKFNKLGKTGGEETHKLTQQELPDVSFAFSGVSWVGGNNGGISHTGEKPWGGEKPIKSGGQGQPINNLQPYITTNAIIKAKK